MTNSDPLDLDAIEARANAASPGPWTQWNEHEFEGPNHEPLTGLYSYEDGGITYERDTIFIAHAREDVPALIAEVRRLRAALASRTVETAEEWEYGVLWARERASGYESDWSGWSWPGDLAGAESFARAHLDGLVLRRRPPGPTEPVPPTPKEASR
jgi:hypothetical protein